jgi:two-component system CheB/CheR fusion protein
VKGSSTRESDAQPAAAGEATAPAGEATAPAGEATATAGAPFPIVGIGASAGGLAAFEQFISSMPPDTDQGIAFIVVQHLAPNHKSVLVELVRQYTKMAVFEAEDDMKVRPNCAYVIPPNRDIAIADSTLSVTPPTMARGLRLPIDHLFRSLAAAHRERSICVVLSGTGSDGTLGVRAVKGEGGMAMAQAPATAEYDGMPLAAIATGMVDYVLPPNEMPQQLIAYVKHAFSGRHERDERPVDLMRGVCALLRSQTGHDFTPYKETTVLRRLDRRMALHQIDNGEDYLRYARENVAEVDALFRDLLIGVTSFFRDPEAFKVLETKVIPSLLADQWIHEPIRVWVAGCSTGEEAYSLAILLHEQVAATNQPRKVQIFATDVDRRAIEQARTGVYPASIVADVPPERLARNFSHDPGSGTYRIQKFIRDLVVFSEHNVVKDPPFSKLNLVSCRNLLIYLNAEAQKRLIPLFHYALRRGGTLFLGPSETIADSVELFQVLDGKWKIYERPHGDDHGARPRVPGFMPSFFDKPPPGRPRAALDNEGAPTDLRSVIEESLLDHYSNSAVLVNARGDILHVVGRTGKFLEPSPGGATTMNVLAMARDGLRQELTVALHKAVTTKRPVSFSGLDVRSNGGFIRTNLYLRPAAPGRVGRDMYLVIFEESVETPPEPVHEPPATEGEPDRRVVALEQTLRAKEEYLRTTLEEMETTNEELQSTNEEMHSVNEELQSTNEELETSREELQSLNEELLTVNNELQEKVSDLSRANDDMNNLLAATGVGTVFVDHQLRIARFTPAATQLINLIPSDLGRPLPHVGSNFVGYDRLAADVQAVLDTLGTIEAEVQVKRGGWYLMRIRPYRTTENVIEGAVLTFVDISERKSAEASLRESQARFHAFVSQASAGVAELGVDGRYHYVNGKLCEMLRYPPEELLQRRVHDLLHPDDRARYAVQFDALVAGGPDFGSDERYVRKDNGVVWTSTRVGAIRSPEGAVRSLVSISFDISERKRLESDLMRVDERLAHDLEAITRLHTVSMLYSGTSTLQAVLDEVLEAALAIASTDRGILQLLEPSGTLRIVAFKGFDPAYVALWSAMAPGAGPAWMALERRERVIASDLPNSTLFSGRDLEAQQVAGVAALRSTPIIGHYQAMLGVITTHFATVYAPEPRTLRLLDLLARQTADIVERARVDSKIEKDQQ